jgi:hypothetical protein
MSQSSKSRTSCPRCGKDVGLHWKTLLPSNSRARSFKCEACGGGYDLSDNTRVASLLAGILSFGPGVLLFGSVVKAGGHSKVAVVAGTACIAALFVVVSLVVAWATLRLQQKN